MAASTPRNSAAVMVTSAASAGFLQISRKGMLLADGAVLGHVASGLAHEPDRRAVDGLGFAGADEAGIGGRHEFLNVAPFQGGRCDRDGAKAITTGGTELHRRKNRSLVKSRHGVTGWRHTRSSDRGLLLGICSSEDRGAASTPTFYKDVLPILQDHCQSCHRVGEVAPMPLVSYEQTRPWAGAMAHAVEMKMMPPWFADSRYGHFSNDASLSDQQIATILAWSAAGAPAGDVRERACAEEMG